MNYKKIELSGDIEGLNTELAFEIAAARADGVELIELSFPSFNAERDIERFGNSVKRTLKNMKGKALIQFFAFPENFERQGTESVYLINKYPEKFEQSESSSEKSKGVFVKL